MNSFQLILIILHCIVFYFICIATFFNSRECKEQIDNDIDAEVDAVKEEEIKMKFMYDSCITLLEDFDTCHRQFSKAIELLANTYNSAIQKVSVEVLNCQIFTTVS